MPAQPTRLRFAVQFGSGVQENSWPLSLPRMRRMVTACLPAKCHSAEISLLVAGSREAKRLNREYRHKDYATNILTFAYQGPPAIKADLVICAPVARREARAQSKQHAHHLAHLLVHGVLHASGLDHEEDSQANAMESLETAILKRFRIPNPYESTGR
jgi:probable rRNA maturation factor